MSQLQVCAPKIVTTFYSTNTGTERESCHLPKQEIQKLSHSCIPPVLGFTLLSEIEWDRIQVNFNLGRFTGYLLFRLVFPFNIITINQCRIVVI